METIKVGDLVELEVQIKEVRETEEGVILVVRIPEDESYSNIMMVPRNRIKEVIEYGYFANEKVGEEHKPGGPDHSGVRQG